MTPDAVTSDQLPASGPPFSVAVRGGGLLFLSGQVAQDPATGELIDGDIAQQADQILRNIAATLAAIGKDLDDVIRVGVLPDRHDAVRRDERDVPQALRRALPGPHRDRRGRPTAGRGGRDRCGGGLRSAPLISGTSRGLGPRRRPPLPWRTFSLPNRPSSQRTSFKSSMRISLTRRPTSASSRGQQHRRPARQRNDHQQRRPRSGDRDERSQDRRRRRGSSGGAGGRRG
jgi:enamine deaminase RidA (YjgF/YER057c/UK114 family)